MHTHTITQTHTTCAHTHNTHTLALTHNTLTRTTLAHTHHVNVSVDLKEEADRENLMSFGNVLQSV